MRKNYTPTEDEGETAREHGSLAFWSPFKTKSRSASRSFSLHTHFLIFVLLMVASVLTSSVMFSLRIRDDESLEGIVQQDLHLLTGAGRLRSRIHQIDLLFEMNNETNDPAWLSKRGRRIRRLNDPALDLAPGPYNSEINGLLSILQNELTLLLRDQEKDILEAAQKKRHPSDMERAADAAARKGVYTTLNAITSAATLELKSSIDKTHKTSVHRMLIRLGVELFSALLIALYLYYFMVAPISEIERTAKDWKAGQPWSPRPAHAIPEIRSLLSKFSQSASNVNVQFRKEHELNEFKTRLVSLVTHEFGNGLAVIQSAAYLLDELSTPQEREIKGKFISMISSNARQLNQEVLNLLNMSRLEAGKLAISFSRTSGEDVVRSVVTRLALLAEKKNQTISLEIAADLLPVEADSSTLALVISNLLTNAIKYTPDRGRINIGIQKEPAKVDRYRFYVQDSGIGISNEDQAKIFGGGGYFRAESGKKMTSKGFGIGLSLAKNIIEAHGSSLELTSSTGNGSRFSFLLPVWRASAKTLFLKEKEVALIQKAS
jgi:signal transduction histidine kinase